jgi:lipid-binding SYLF domain-containing protein
MIMKRTTRGLALTMTLGLLLAGAQPVLAEQESGDWRSLKREAKRAKIDEMANLALKTLIAKSSKAEALYGESYGYAVFDNLKLAFFLSGGGGNGVAVVKASGDRTYMKMGTAGIGIGLGGKKFQVVFLFQDERTFTNFVNRGWQADASASAAAGNEGTGVQTGFVNGLAVYQLGETGLIAQVDIAGTKYWQNEKLNETTQSGEQGESE